MSRELTLKLELDTSPLLQKLNEAIGEIQSRMVGSQENIKKLVEKSAESITIPEPKVVPKETKKTEDANEKETLENPEKTEESSKKETAKKKKEDTEPLSFQGFIKDAQKDFQELSQVFSQSMAVAFHRMKKSANFKEMFASGRSTMEQMFSKIRTSDAVTKFSENGKKRWKEAAETGKTAFSDFFTKMRKANSFKDITASVLNLGSKGFTALVRLAGPWGLIVAGATAAFAVIVKLTSQFSKLEDAARKASNAFRMGGRMEGVGMAGFQRQARAMSADGSLNYQDMLQGMGNLRKSGFSLDTKTFEEVTKVAKDGASFLGGTYSQTLEQLGGILHSTEVSYDELVNAGMAFTAAEYRQIEALKGVHNQAARNELILAKMKETYQGAAGEEANTVSGMMGTFGNHMKGFMQDIGAVLAPIVKVVMGIVNPLVEALRGLISPIADSLGGVLGDVANIIMGLVAPCLSALAVSLSMVGKTIGLIHSVARAILKPLGELCLFIGEKFASAITKIKDAIGGFFDKIRDWLEGWYLGWLMGEKSEGKEKSEYIDPRARMNVNFEDTTSMNQRIQKSLLERNSPAVKQVDLLTALNSKVEVLVGQSEKANAHRKEHKDLTQKELKAMQEFAPGLG